MSDSISTSITMFLVPLNYLWPAIELDFGDIFVGYTETMNFTFSNFGSNRAGDP